MKFRNIITYILTLIITITLVGCGDITTDNMQAEKAPYNIIWYDTGRLTRDHDLVYEDVNKYTIDKIGVTVKCIPLFGSEFSEKMKMIFASNEKFDMCFTSSGTHFEINAAKNAFLPLDDLLNAYGKETKEMLPDYAIQGAKANGVLYGLPMYKDYAQENVFYYRTDLAEKYNFDMNSVKKFSDIEPMLKTIKNLEPNVYPFVFSPSFSPFAMLPFDPIAGGVIGAIDLSGDKNKIINPFNTPEALEYFKTIHSFYKQGFMRSDIATATTNSDISGSEFLKVEQELPYLVDQRNKTSKYKYSVLHMSTPVINTSCIRGAMLSISRNSENPEKTMQFINLLNTDKYLRNLVSYGIEGKHYISVGEDHYRLPDGVLESEKPYSTFVFTQGNKYVTRMIEGTPDDIFDKYKQFDNNAAKSPALGFAFDPSNLKSEFSAVSNVYKEYMPSLLGGSADPEVYLPKAIEKLKASGVDKLIAEMQSQYDQWRVMKN